MSKDSIYDWDTNANNNQDIAGIGILGTNNVSNFDGALRTVMAQVAASLGPNKTSVSGFLSGLGTQNNVGDAVNDIDIAAGSAATDSATAPIVMNLATAITKRLDATWAVGTNQGGLDTGAIGDNAYHIWLIKRPDTGVVDALFSLSATAPTMPANYTLKRRIASIIRTAGAIVAYRQFDNVFKRPVIGNYNTAAALASVLFPFSVPAGIVVQPILSVLLSVPAASNVTVSFGDAIAGTADVPIIQNTAAGIQKLYTNGGFYTDTSRNLYLAVTVGAGSITAIVVSTYGWIDTRGQ